MGSGRAIKVRPFKRGSEFERGDFCKVAVKVKRVLEVTLGERDSRRG